MAGAVQTKYRMVETTHDLREAAGVLAGAGSIVLDLEGDTLFHYGETLCLVQMSDGVQTWLVDPLRVTDLSPLAPVLENPAVEKILHGADYDIRLLRRHSGINCRAIFDTELAARFLGIRRSGLADILGERFGVALDKKFQKRDWSRRPLSAEMRSYAAADVRWLDRLAATLKSDLEGLGRLSWVEEECDVLSRSPDRCRENGPLFLRFKGAGLMGRRSLAVLEAILQMRELLAKERDVPPFKVLDPAVIKQIVQERPETDGALVRITGLGRRSEKFRGGVLTAVKEALDMPEERLPAYPRGGGRKLSGHGRFHARVDGLKEWRDRRAAALNLDGSLVCTVSVIESLAAKRPVTSDGLDEIEGLRNWQKREFGAEICDVLRRTG